MKKIQLVLIAFLASFTLLSMNTVYSLDVDHMVYRADIKIAAKPIANYDKNNWIKREKLEKKIELAQDETTDDYVDEPEEESDYYEEEASEEDEDTGYEAEEPENEIEASEEESDDDYVEAEESESTEEEADVDEDDTSENEEGEAEETVDAVEGY